MPFALQRSRGALLRHALGAVTFASLAACGGGGGSDNGPPPPAAVAQAVADAYTLSWNAPTTLGVAENDTATGGSPAVSIDSAPKSGTATVSGTKVTYTPNAGFFGSDSFSYKLTVGSASQTAAVKLTVEASLTLQGQVTDAPIANAVVQASVGSQSYSATADANGNYNLTLRTSEPTDFVTLTATGVGTQSNVVLTSLLGEAKGLAGMAKEGKLAADQKVGLNVSHLSAAQAGLINQTGATPKTDAELATALRNLSPQSVLLAAAAVKLVVDGGVAMPEGTADTRALLNSTSTYAAFQSGLRRNTSDQLNSAQRDTLRDASLSKAPPTPVGGGADTVLIYGWGEGAGTPLTRVLTLRADGTGVEINDQPRSFKWQRADHEVIVTYDQAFPITTLAAGTGIFIGDEVVDANVRTLVSATGLKLSDIGPDSSQMTLASVTTLATATDLEGPQQGMSRAVSGSDLMRRHTVGALSFKAEDFPVGTKLAGVSAAVGINATGGPQSNQDVVTFTSATELSFARTGDKASWKIVDGRLRVDLPQVSHLYTLLGKGPLGDSRWLLQELDSQGNAKSAFELGVIGVGAAPVLDRSFWLRPLLSNIGSTVALPTLFRFLNDGRAASTGVPLNEEVPAPFYRYYWREVEGGRIELSFARSLTCVVYMPDGTPGPQPCTLAQTRYWQPLAQTGNTVWVMQQGAIVFGTDGSTTASDRWSLVALTWQDN